jgi:hypothetical protein
MATVQMSEELFLSIARAFYSTRLHMLTLTEVVRHNIRPDRDGLMRLPPEMDKEMKKLAFDFLLAMFPLETHGLLEKAKEEWMTQQ